MRRDSSTLEAGLAALDAQQLRRTRRTVERYAHPGDRIEVIVDGEPLLDFCGNDYLGLARHPDVAATLAASAARIGTGSGSAHLVSGHGQEHARLEEALAQYTGYERTLLFSTGYMANLAVISALAGRGDRVLLDRLSHASLIDGARLSGARFTRYPHNDVAAAARLLGDERSDTGRTQLIATDGLFSMDGDIAPLPELARLAGERGAWLIVDDAHGLGVLGARGRGSLEHFGLGCEQVPLLVGTFGKAFGTFGAFVAGEARLIEYLMQKSRTYLFTTALPQALAAATRRALEIAASEAWRRERLGSLIMRFRAGAAQLGVPLSASITPIQPIVLGSAAAALRAQDALARAGLWVAAIRPPTVPVGGARLRITLSSAHTETQVDRLLDALGSTCVPAHECATA